MKFVKITNLRQVFGHSLDESGLQSGRWYQHAAREGDLNERVNNNLSVLASMIDHGLRHGLVTFTTIQLDLEPRGFPDLVANYFAAPTWDYTWRFRLHASSKSSSQAMVAVGEFTCEVDGTAVQSMLRYNKGHRWGANLRVRGAQASESAATRVLALSPFSAANCAALDQLSASCFSFTHDLDVLDVFVTGQSRSVSDWFEDSTH